MVSAKHDQSKGGWGGGETAVEVEVEDESDGEEGNGSDDFSGDRKHVRGWQVWGR